MIVRQCFRHVGSKYALVDMESQNLNEEETQEVNFGSQEESVAAHVVLLVHQEDCDRAPHCSGEDGGHDGEVEDYEATEVATQKRADQGECKYQASAGRYQDLHENYVSKGTTSPSCLAKLTSGFRYRSSIGPSAQQMMWRAKADKKVEIGM